MSQKSGVIRNVLARVTGGYAGINKSKDKAFVRECKKLADLFGIAFVVDDDDDDDHDLDGLFDSDDDCHPDGCECPGCEYLQAVECTRGGRQDY